MPSSHHGRSVPPAYWLKGEVHSARNAPEKSRHELAAAVADPVPDSALKHTPSGSPDDVACCAIGKALVALIVTGNPVHSAIAVVKQCIFVGVLSMILVPALRIRLYDERA